MIMMPGAVRGDILSRVRAETQQRIDQAEASLAQRHPEISAGTDAFAFLEMSSRGGDRFDLLFGPEHAAVQELSRTGSWVPLVHQVLGDDAMCMCGVVYSRPGAPDQQWHADGGHIAAVCDW